MSKKVKKEDDGVLRFGPMVQRAAESLGKTLDELALDMLVKPHALELETKGVTDTVTFMPGNDFGGRTGINSDTDVMIIGKAPSHYDLMNKHIFRGETGKLMCDVFNDTDIDYSNWYLTNVVKFLPPRSAKTLKASWLQECRPFLDIELETIKPKYILLLGTDAIKALFGKGMSLKKLRGSDDLRYGDAKVMVTTHPAAVIASPEQRPAFERDLKAFVTMVKDAQVERHPVTYEDITSIDRLKEVVAEITAKWDHDPDSECRLAVDCEWGSKIRSDYLKGKLRTIQFSDSPYTGYCVVIRRQNLEIDDNCCEEDQLAEVLKPLLNHPRVKLGGHNLREDMKWLLQIGINCEPYFDFDSMLAFHLGYPTAEGVALEVLAVRFTDVGRYDLKVKNWLSANGYGGDDSKAKEKLRKYGYSEVPDDILHPYATTDVDVIMRFWPTIVDRLKTERVSNPYELFPGQHVETLWDIYRYIVHPVNIPLQEIEMTGIYADEDRLVRLTELFQARELTMVAEFRDKIKWPEFNYRSVDQAREFLFSNSFGKKRVRPEGAITMNLTPIKTTEKPSRDWNKVTDYEVANGLVSPSTDAESLLILAAEHPLVKEFQRLRFVDQVKKNFLRPPELDKDTNELEWKGGLMYELNDDKRIRTSLNQVTDTGRYRCVAGDTLLETSEGTFRIDSLDLTKYTECRILTHTGKMQRILDCFLKGQEKMYEVTTEAGYAIKCTENHRFRTGETWTHLRDISVGDIVTSVRDNASRVSRSERAPTTDNVRGIIQNVLKYWDELPGIRGVKQYKHGSDKSLSKSMGSAVRYRAKATAKPAICQGNAWQQARQTSTSFGCTGQEYPDEMHSTRYGGIPDSYGTADDSVPSSKQHALLRLGRKGQNAVDAICRLTSVISNYIGAIKSGADGCCIRLHRRSDTLLRTAICGIPFSVGSEIFDTRAAESTPYSGGVWTCSEKSHSMGGQQGRNTTISCATQAGYSSYSRCPHWELCRRFLDRKYDSRGRRNISRQPEGPRKGSNKCEVLQRTGLQATTVHREGSGSKRRQLCYDHTEFCDDRIVSIKPVGVQDVWDIAVETDQSYVAHGLVHHNSSRPNMQNLPKKQEGELRQLFSPDREKLLATRGWGGMSEVELKEMGLLDLRYYTIRSCFMASPGHLMIEADYSQAELNVMAHLAKDKDMIAVMSDPDRDLHSEMAITAFQLDCEPAEVKKLYPTQRVMAKNVNFGS